MSYPFGHGKAMALEVLTFADHSGLYTVFGEQSANHQQLLETRRKFICSFYGVATDSSVVSVRYALYIKRTTGKAVYVKFFPPRDANWSYHILRSHYQVMLWKAAGCMSTPRITREPAAHPALMNVINCQCNAARKACCSHACSCYSEVADIQVGVNKKGDYAYDTHFTETPVLGKASHTLKAKVKSSHDRKEEL